MANGSSSDRQSSLAAEPFESIEPIESSGMRKVAHSKTRQSAPRPSKPAKGGRIARLPRLQKTRIEEHVKQVISRASSSLRAPLVVVFLWTRKGKGPFEFEWSLIRAIDTASLRRLVPHLASLCHLVVMARKARTKSDIRRPDPRPLVRHFLPVVAW
jgi:hypothetical protein